MVVASCHVLPHAWQRGIGNVASHAAALPVVCHLTQHDHRMATLPRRIAPVATTALRQRHQLPARQGRVFGTNKHIYCLVLPSYFTIVLSLSLRFRPLFFRIAAYCYVCRVSSSLCLLLILLLCQFKNALCCGCCLRDDCTRVIY